MEPALTLIGIEVPRSFQKTPDGRRLSPGEWRIGDQNVGERAIRAALAYTSPEHVRLLSGEPDEGVFRLVEKYGVSESDLGAWMQAAYGRAARAGPDDLLVLLRAEVALADYASLGKAIEALRAEPSLNRVEPVYRPRREAPADTWAVTRANGCARLTPFPGDALNASEMALACPAFEAHRLLSLARPPVTDAAGFVWIDEDDFVPLETALDFIRAEIMLGEA